MSDGETREEAMANGKDALAAWLLAAEETGREVPRPEQKPSGKFVARVPRSLHAQGNRMIIKGCPRGYGEKSHPMRP